MTRAAITDADRVHVPLAGNREAVLDQIYRLLQRQLLEVGRLGLECHLKTSS